MMSLTILRVADRLVADLEAKELEALGLNISSARALLALRLEGADGLMLSALAEASGIQISTLSRIVDRLRARKLLSRRRQTDDGRTVRIVITAAGSEMAAKVHRAIRDRDTALFGATVSEDNLRAAAAALAPVADE